MHSSPIGPLGPQPSPGGEQQGYPERRAARVRRMHVYDAACLRAIDHKSSAGLGVARMPSMMPMAVQARGRLFAGSCGCHRLACGAARARAARLCLAPMFGP